MAGRWKAWKRSRWRRTLVFSVTALDFFVLVFLYLSLEDSSSGRFVEAGGLENVGSVDPVIVTASHDMLFEVEAELKLVDRDLPLTVRNTRTLFRITATLRRRRKEGEKEGSSDESHVGA